MNLRDHALGLSGGGLFLFWKLVFYSPQPKLPASNQGQSKPIQLVKDDKHLRDF